MKTNLEIQYRNTKDLVPYAGNAKEHPTWQIEQIANSIEEFGFNDPIGIWTNEQGQPEIVEGHGRVLAANVLGIDTVPVILLDHLDDEQRRAYILAHNQLTMNTEFNFEVLKAELEKITQIDMEALGFEMPETLEDYEVQEVETPEVEDDEPKTKPGDIYKLGNHRLICGDSTKPETLERLMDGAVADMLLTDPPYNVDYHGGGNGGHNTIQNDNFQSEQNFESFLVDAMKNGRDNLKPGGAFYVWFASSHSLAVYSAMHTAELLIRQELEWVKSSLVLGRQDYQWQHEPCVYGWKDGAAHYFANTRSETTVIEDRQKLTKMSKQELRELCEKMLGEETETTVLRYDKPSSSDLHPTMKPVKLMAHLLRNSSKPGEKVLDLFGGSGSTMMACEQMKRSCYTVELDPHFCDVIVARWEEYTGEKAELV